MPKTRQHRSYYIPLGCIVPLILFGAALLAYLLIPWLALGSYGPPSDKLSGLQRVQYAALVMWYDGLLTSPADLSGAGRAFRVSAGESPSSVAARLEQVGLIRNADALRAYLAYSGLDTGIQAGEYMLSPALSPMQMAERLQDATPAQVTFVVLPGWRMEEIAASLPTSGLNVSPDEFLVVARAPRANLNFLPSSASAEGFLFPDEYSLPRAMRADQLVNLLLNHFALALTPEMRAGFSRHGLSIYQAVTLASIIQREAVQDDERPIIASVFLNRIAAGMRLETDPTIQYALGFQAANSSWWKVPLALDDLKINSPYNTYTNVGLPPGPIANPSLGALQAVASAADTSYLFFRARCDGSGRHAFAKTFQEHLKNGCP
jgi:UPF0755 protein